MKIPFGKPIIGDEEREAVLNVLDGPILVHGPIAQQFEEAFADYCGGPYAVSVTSCTAGMHLVYMAIGLGEGDEVIVPAQTHVATANAVALTGATPIFIDSEEYSGNIDIAAIEAAITPCTRAIAVVHYLGVPVDMQAVLDIADQHQLFVLEDCALAIGAKFGDTHVGLHGDVGVFSFYPVKHMTTAEGGMIILKDQCLAQRLQLLKAFGVDRPHGKRSVAGQYDTIALGLNYRMSEVHAAIGLAQLKKLPSFLDIRRANYRDLLEFLSEGSNFKILPQPCSTKFESSHYCMGVILDEDLSVQRAAISSAMATEGIGTSIYYPRPVPGMTYYKEKYKCDMQHYQAAQKISNSMIALPVGPHLGNEDMEQIGEKFLALIDQYS